MSVNFFTGKVQLTDRTHAYIHKTLPAKFHLCSSYESLDKAVKPSGREFSHGHRRVVYFLQNVALRIKCIFPTSIIIHTIISKE
jgi:hypothetical protein